MQHLPFSNEKLFTDTVATSLGLKVLRYNEKVLVNNQTVTEYDGIAVNDAGDLCIIECKTLRQYNYNAVRQAYAHAQEDTIAYNQHLKHIKHAHRVYGRPMQRYYLAHGFKDIGAFFIVELDILRKKTVMHPLTGGGIAC